MQVIKKIYSHNIILILSALVPLLFSCNTPKPRNVPPNNKENKTHLKFDFGSGEIKDGFQQVLPTTIHSTELGYGIISETPVKTVAYDNDDALRSDFITSDSPFYFVIDLPEGNYEVTIILGDQKGESTTTVKAESRRLMLEQIQTPKGKVETHTFVVNVRTPKIDENAEIRRKPREMVYLNWDDKLTLEFNDARPCVAGIELKRIDDIITMYLAGNSTVVDQEYEPWASWGQMITRFLKPNVVVANYAESGESLKSFVGAKRLDKIMSTLKKGDYLFIEFAHNDQKPGGSHVEPFTSYKEMLRVFIDSARKKEAIPVLVTSTRRRAFDANGKLLNTLGDYPVAMRQLAKEEDVACIDLNAMTKAFYEALGPEKSKVAFVHYPAGTFPGQDRELKDDTHFSNYGAYQIAKCVIEGVKSNGLGLAGFIRDDVKSFDPANPDPFEAWELPRSSSFVVAKPDGN